MKPTCGLNESDDKITLDLKLGVVAASLLLINGDYVWMRSDGRAHLAFDI